MQLHASMLEILPTVKVINYVLVRLKTICTKQCSYNIKLKTANPMLQNYISIVQTIIDTIKQS